MAYYKIKKKKTLSPRNLKVGPLLKNEENFYRDSLSLSLSSIKAKKTPSTLIYRHRLYFLFSLLVLVISNFQSYVSGTHKFLSFFFHLVKQINPSNLAFPFRCLISCFSFVICCVYVWFFRAVSYLIYSGLKSKFDQFNNHFRFSHSLSICSRHFLF